MFKKLCGLLICFLLVSCSTLAVVVAEAPLNSEQMEDVAFAQIQQETKDVDVTENMTRVVGMFFNHTKNVTNSDNAQTAAIIEQFSKSLTPDKYNMFLQYLSGNESAVRAYNQSTYYKQTIDAANNTLKGWTNRTKEAKRAFFRTNGGGIEDAFNLIKTCPTEERFAIISETLTLGNGWSQYFTTIQGLAQRSSSINSGDADSLDESSRMLAHAIFTADCNYKLQNEVDHKNERLYIDEFLNNTDSVDKQLSSLDVLSRTITDEKVAIQDTYEYLAGLGGALVGIGAAIIVAGIVIGVANIVCSLGIATPAAIGIISGMSVAGATLIAFGYSSTRSADLLGDIKDVLFKSMDDSLATIGVYKAELEPHK